LIALAAWAVVVAACFRDLEIGGTLYTSSATIDYQKHNAVTDAICRTGLPPVNPSFYPGRPLPLYYYYLWFLTSAQVRLLSGGLIGNYPAVLATSIWVGYGVWATILLLLRRFPPPVASGSPRQRDLIATALLALTGLDIVVVVISGIHGLDSPRWPLTVEWYLSGIAYW